MNDEEKIEAIEKVIDEIWIDNLERVRKESDNDPRGFMIICYHIQKLFC